MSARRLLAVASLVFAACTSNAPPPAAPEATSAPAPVATAMPTVDAGAPAVPVDPAFAALPPSLSLVMPASDPKAVTRSGKSWPFHAWDRADIVVFNWEEDGPVQQRAYDDDGWTKKLKYRAPLEKADASRAVDLILTAKGESLVSKCAFPRHAVVLYDGDMPVASINVCFTCHDIMLWPEWQPKNPTDADYARMEFTSQKMLPEWNALFVSEHHFPLWPAAH